MQWAASFTTALNRSTICKKEATMSHTLRIIPERRTGNDRRRIFSLHRFFHKGSERRKALQDRRVQEERRDGWVRISKWSSVYLDDLKISKYLH
jgi:hypothetical protein